MSDELNYTLNDPTEVECPFCHKKMDLEDDLSGFNVMDTECEHCGRSIHLEVETTITVLAWKPEAIR